MKQEKIVLPLKLRAHLLYIALIGAGTVVMSAGLIVLFWVFQKFGGFF